MVPEPFLRLPRSEVGVRVGSIQTITIESTQPEVTLGLGDLLDGIQVVGSKKPTSRISLKWKPKDDQIGEHVIPVTLSSNDIQRVVDFRLRVEQPSIRVPIEMTDFEVSPTGTFCVAWSGTDNEHRRRMVLRSDDKPLASELCVVPFRTGMKPIAKEIPFLVYQVAMAGPHRGTFRNSPAGIAN